MRKNYDKYSVAQLKKIAQRHFNAWIRERDKGKPCINCHKFTKLQAGHYFSVGSYGGLRYDEDNCHGECVRCNFFNSESHKEGYLPNLKEKIGEAKFKDLETRAAYLKRHRHQWDRFELLLIIEKYKK